MGQQKTASRSNYPLALKVELLDRYQAGEKSLAALAEEKKIPAGNLYNWSVNEKAVRAAYAKELKQAERNGNGSGVVNGNGATPHKVQPVEKEPTTKLQILGLTPLIKELVKSEVNEQLPVLLEEALKKAFNKV